MEGFGIEGFDYDKKPQAEPADPSELWMLRFDDETGFVRAIDSVPEALCLVCFNEDDAKTAAEYQNDNFLDNPCHPVRVK